MKRAGCTQEKKQYFREVKSGLQCSSPLRRRILDELAQVIESEPELSRQELEKRFGTPQQFSANVSEGLEPGQTAPKNLRWRAAAILFMLTFMFTLAAGMFFWKSRPKEQAEYSILIIRPDDGSSETVHLPAVPVIK